MRSFIASAALLALAALPTTLAMPFQFTNCPVKVRPNVPAGALIVDNKALKVQFVGLGLGTQNYTCSAEGKPVSAGAVAKLYDVSCLVSLPFFKNVTDVAMRLGGARQRGAVTAELSRNLGGNPLTLGDHYFFTNAAGGISPKFDFTASQRKSSFVVSKRTNGIPSPQGATNIDWLELGKVEGNIGTQVFRLDTRLGQPAAATCTPGSAIAPSQYAAVYWFLG